METLPSVTEELLKPTATIHVGSKLSLIERKVFNAIIWHSQKNRFKRQDDVLSIPLLMSLIGLERSKNMEVIKESLETLVTTPIVWNTLKKDRTADWGICTFLSGAELSGGRLRYVLNPLLIEKVNNPTLFAKIQLLVQTQFSSKYSVILYEYLLDELGRAGNPPTLEVAVSLDTIRHILQFDGAYKHLNSDVLTPCVREINKVANIAVGYTGVKTGRAVTGIRFAVTRTAFQLKIPLDDLHVPEGDTALPARSKDDVTALLLTHGVGKRKAKELIERFDEERIRENLSYALRAHAEGKVQKLSAYLIRAIEEDYRPKKTPAELEREAQAREEEAQAKEARRREELTRAFETYRGERVRERFAALPSPVQESLRGSFLEKLRIEQPFAYGKYAKEGFGSRFVEPTFFAELQAQLLTEPEETDIEAFGRRFGTERQT